MSEPAVISSAASTATAPRRRWGRNILLLLLSLVGLGVVAVVFFLDPWLRRTLEDQVATASRGRYQLRIGELKTSLWQGAATVRHVQLFTAATSPAADTTAPPDIRLDLGELRVAGTEWAPAVQNINLRAASLHIGPNAYNAPGFLYYARSWQVQTGRARVAFNAPYYRLAVGSMRLDTRQQTLALGLVQMAPTMTVAEQARRKGHQAAHVTLRLPELALQGLDFPALLRRGSLRARQLDLRNGRIVTSSDGRFPVNPRQSVATPEAIGRLPFRVDVRQARITNAGIRMIYRSPRSAQIGVMAIQELTATLRNISNDPRRMSAATPMTGEATGVLQKKSHARLRLQANLLDPAGRHTLQGSFSAAPLAMLNPMVVPTRGIRLRSGQIEQIRFEMQLDRQQARGTMWAQYYGLKLDLLNKKNKRGVLHRVGTTLANGVFLRDNNPRQPGQELQTGQMNSDRQLRFSVFSLWRQGLVSGLLNSAGVLKPLAKKLSEAE